MCVLKNIELLSIRMFLSVALGDRVRQTVLRPERDDGDLVGHVQPERHQSSQSGVDVEVASLLLVESLVGTASPLGRPVSEELHLSAVGVSAQRQLGRGLGQYVSSPGRGVVLQHHHKCPWPHALKGLPCVGKVGEGWLAVVLRACHDEGVATASDDEMVIAQQPPPQGVLLCLHEQAQQALLSLVGVFGVARIVVVAEHGDHALGRTAQQVGVGKDFLGTDVLHVAREDHQVGVLPGDGVHLRLEYLLSPAVEGAEVEVGDMEDLVAVEGCGEVVKLQREVVYLHLSHADGQSIDIGQHAATAQQDADVVAQVDARPARQPHQTRPEEGAQGKDGLRTDEEAQQEQIGVEPGKVGGSKTRERSKGDGIGRERDARHPPQ